MGSGSDLIPVKLLGRQWVEVDSEPLQVYALPNLRMSLGPHFYTFADVGGPLKLLSRDHDNEISLGMLRLVGISRPQGVTFRVCFPYSNEMLSSVCENLERAVTHFVTTYIQDASYTFKVSRNEEADIPF
jgi:hypothetical protein